MRDILENIREHTWCDRALNANEAAELVLGTFLKSKEKTKQSLAALRASISDSILTQDDQDAYDKAEHALKASLSLQDAKIAEAEERVSLAKNYIDSDPPGSHKLNPICRISQIPPTPLQITEYPEIYRPEKDFLDIFAKKLYPASCAISAIARMLQDLSPETTKICLATVFIQIAASAISLPWPETDAQAFTAGSTHTPLSLLPLKQIKVASLSTTQTQLALLEIASNVMAHYLGTSLDALHITKHDAAYVDKLWASLIANQAPARSPQSNALDQLLLAIAWPIQRISEYDRESKRVIINAMMIEVCKDPSW